MKNSIFLAIIITIVLASCGGYEKILKSSDNQLKYDKAFEYFEKEDYVRASTLFEQISNYFKGTIKADTLQFYRAMSYFNSKDYLMASHYFGEIPMTFPNSDFAEQSEYLRAYCLYKLSPRPSLDQDYTFQAINAFTLFLINYPESEKRQQCLDLVAELRDKLVEKSYLSAKLYFDRGYYKSAIVALRNSLNEFPETKYREQVLFLILKSNYLLAFNSVPEKRLERYQAAVDEYYSFIGEFPEGEYSKEALNMYEDSMKQLGQAIN